MESSGRPWIDNSEHWKKELLNQALAALECLGRKTFYHSLSWITSKNSDGSFGKIPSLLKLKYQQQRQFSESVEF